MNVDAHENPAVQPDWKQNDDTASDYIKNRPFYEEVVDTLLDPTLENWRTLTKTNLDTLTCSWRVAGVDYIDVTPARHESGTVAYYELGSAHVTVISSLDYIEIGPHGADVHLLKRESNVKQLDPKFIPMATSDALGVVQPGNQKQPNLTLYKKGGN